MQSIKVNQCITSYALDIEEGTEYRCFGKEWPDKLENIDGTLKLYCHAPRLNDCPEELMPTPVSSL